MRNKQYFQLITSGKVANLNIFGDITSYPVNDADVSFDNLSKQLAELGDVTQINVNINSYGGEVMEGLAIYNALKRHKAHVTTYCDGSACSIASVIFMAGDERVMCKPSFLMIHDAWTVCGGNAAALRKQADDLDVITSASVTAYMEHVNISEERLRELMKAESWLTHDEALEMGFATSIEEPAPVERPSQSIKNRFFEMLAKCIRMQVEFDTEDEAEPKKEADDDKAPETPVNAPDSEDEEEPADDEEGGKSGDSGDDDAPDDDDNKKSNEKTDDDNKNNDENPDPAQKWSGFFNALFRE